MKVVFIDSLKKYPTLKIKNKKEERKKFVETQTMIELQGMQKTSQTSGNRPPLAIGRYLSYFHSLN